MKQKILNFSILVFCLLLFIVHNSWAINIASDLCQKKTSDIGNNYSDAIKIVNNESEPVEVKVYQTDYLFYSDGKRKYGDPGKDHRSNAQWIDKLPQQITIPPDQTTILQYSVTVPNNQELSGSYWSMIMVEEINPEKIESVASGENKVGIHQIVRYGIQVVTNIGNSGIRQLDFQGLKLTKGENKRFLKIDLENSGTRALYPMIWVDFYSEDGGYSKKISGRQQHIYPECSIMQKLDISNIPLGIYKAVVVADAGEETVFGTSFSIKIEE